MQSSRRGEKQSPAKEENRKTLEHDPYAVPWILKSKSKRMPDIVGHVLRAISRFMWYFFTHDGNIEAIVLSTQPKPSPIQNGGLKIVVKAKLIIDEKYGDISKHPREIIGKNYVADISNTKKNPRKTEILKLKLKRTLISGMSSLLMMTRIIRRSSFLYFHVSFKKKKK